MIQTFNLILFSRIQGFELNKIEQIYKVYIIKSMRQVSSTILKGKYLDRVIMTTAAGTKKSIVQLSNHLKQIAENNGVASLSACQLGSQNAIFVMLQKQFLRPAKFSNYKSKSCHYQAFVNPKILDSSVNQVDSWQQCPSYPSLKFLIKRSTHVIVQYQKSFKDKAPTKEELTGFRAVLFQHQCTHLKCQNLFDVCQDVDLIQNKQVPTQKRQKLKEQFLKFIRQRIQSKGQLANFNQTQPNKNQIFSYKKCKDLKNFVQYEIVDPL